MWTSTNKKYYLFIGIILLIGIISGFFFFGTLNLDLQNTIKTAITNYFLNINSIKINQILIHLLIMSFLAILSFLLMGLPANLLYIFCNGFVLGFIISVYTIVNGLNGFIFSLIYIIITKIPFILVLMLFTTTSLKISIYLFNIVIKKDKSIKTKISLLFKKMLFCITLVFFIDLFIYFVGDNLINVFNFLVI